MVDDEAKGLSRRWTDLDAAPRHPASSVTRDLLPEQPGVYAWYRDGKRMYIGKADSLRARVWSNHLGKSRSLGTSAFRRNVAADHGFGSAADIKAGKITLTEEQ